MALREIPTAYIKSKDLLLRLKKEGPYSVKDSKPVTVKYIELAISGDEDLIEEFKRKLDVEKVRLVESVEKKYLQIKDTGEWKALCDAYSKLCEYKRLCNVWTKEYCHNEDAYDEIKEIIDQTFVSKYEEIISNNIYKEFYLERNELKYSKDAYYLALIEDIEKSIEELREYCLQHPNEIKGNRKNR